MTKLTPVLVCLALAVSAALAACGSSSDEGSAGTAPASTTATSQTPPPGGREVKVSIKDIKFKPPSITANKGQKIVWTNDDPVAHTVTATKGAKFDSGTLDPGGRYEQTISKAGKVDYVCTIHPNQAGTITIK